MSEKATPTANNYTLGLKTSAIISIASPPSTNVKYFNRTQENMSRFWEKI